MRSVLALLALAACQAYETVKQTVSSHGTVYVCETGESCIGVTTEYCWNGDERELESLIGAECHQVRLTERLWPALTGCAYCCGDGCPRGCNAHCGCFCEPEEP